MDKTLIKVLQKHRSKKSFHTPGHSNTLPSQLLKYDITELHYSDNLLFANGVLKELEQRLSCIYNSKRAFISTNGATNCILTAIYAVKEYGSFLIVGNAHNSVYNALRILKCKAYHINNLTDIDIETLPDDIGVLLITSPDYYGNCLDLNYYSTVAKKKNLLFVIDSSHGSHFIFSEKLPLSVTEYADLVIHSLHKTLPVPTGGACLFCQCSDLIDSCAQARKLFHSSSPSYITLAGIDRAINIMVKKGKTLYENVYNAVKRFKEESKGAFECALNDDFSRLVLKSGFVGKEVMTTLSSMGFEMEMSSHNLVVAIVTPFNYKYLKRLAKALRKISNLPVYVEIPSLSKKNETISLLHFGGEMEYVDLDKAEGRRAYSEVSVYPPGTPIVKSGEVITKEIINILKENAVNSFGLENNTIAVILYNDGGTNE